MRGWIRLGLVMGIGGSLGWAQDAGPSPRMPRAYRGVETVVGGIFVTPVAGAPFSATVEIVSHEKLPDGTEHVTTTRDHIARASSGRIYNERRRMMAAGYTGEPMLLSGHIYDPSSRQSIFLNPFRHLAQEVTLRAPEKTPARALPPAQTPKAEGEVETALGTKSMDGVELSGTRRTREIAAAESGTGKPIVVTDEYWYSPALSIYMMIRHDDPRTGEQLVAVTKVERTEPPAETFAVPANYKVVDETTDEAPMAAQ